MPLAFSVRIPASNAPTPGRMIFSAAITSSAVVAKRDATPSFFSIFFIEPRLLVP